MQITHRPFALLLVEQSKDGMHGDNRLHVPETVQEPNHGKIAQLLHPCIGS